MTSARLADAPPALRVWHAEHVERTRRLERPPAAVEPVRVPPPPPEPPPPVPPVLEPRLPLAEIVHAVAVYYGVPVALVMSDSRKVHAVRPRHVAIHIARRLTKYSFPQIGRQFHRDHTTAMYADRHIAFLRDDDGGQVAGELCAIMSSLGVVG
jgi:Bacterial dnaA protein helix-turn-helix